LLLAIRVALTSKPASRRYRETEPSISPAGLEIGNKQPAPINFRFDLAHSPFWCRFRSRTPGPPRSDHSIKVAQQQLKSLGKLASFCQKIGLVIQLMRE
jgi:hypothetical protein